MRSNLCELWQQQRHLQPHFLVTTFQFHFSRSLTPYHYSLHHSLHFALWLKNKSSVSHLLMMIALVWCDADDDDDECLVWNAKKLSPATQKKQLLRRWLHDLWLTDYFRPPLIFLLISGLSRPTLPSPSLGPLPVGLLPNTTHTQYTKPFFCSIAAVLSYRAHW